MTGELTPGGVDSTYHASEVGEMSTSVLVEGHSNSGTAAFHEMIATQQPSFHTQEQRMHLGFHKHLEHVFINAHFLVLTIHKVGNKERLLCPGLLNADTKPDVQKYSIYR